VVYNLGLGNSLPKQLLRLKLEGAWLGKYPKKVWTTCLGLFLQLFNLMTSNLIHNVHLGVIWQKQLLGPKVAGVWAREAPLPKFGTPTYFKFATIEAGDFKFGP